MKKWILPAALLCAAMLGGCAAPAAGGGTASGAAVMESIAAWPDNAYTRAVPEPDAGTPDYVITDEQADYFAVFYKDITMEQGERYLETLRDDGFTRVAGDGNSVSIGEMLWKDGVSVNVSVSTQLLGIYIKLNAEDPR